MSAAPPNPKLIIKATPRADSKGAPFPLYSVAWTHNGTVIVGGGGGQPGVGVPSGLIAYEYKDGRLTQYAEIDTHDEMVQSIAVHPMRNEVSCAVGPFNIILGITKKKTIHQKADVVADFSAKEPFTNVCAYSADGKFIVTGGDDHNARIWRYPTTLYRALPGFRNDICDVDFRSDSQQIAVCALSQKDVRLFDLGHLDAEPLKVQCDGYVKGCGYAKWDGKDVLIGAVNARASKGPCSLVAWDPKTGKQLSSARISGEAVLKLVTSRDGKMVAASVGVEGGSVYVYTSKLSFVTANLNAHHRVATGLAFSPSGRTVVSVSNDHSIVFTDTSSRGWFNMKALLLNFVVVVLLAIGLSRIGGLQWVDQLLESITGSSP